MKIFGSDTVKADCFLETIGDSVIAALAVSHNVTNKGSRKSTWMERVTFCRKRLYKAFNLPADTYLISPTPIREQNNKAYKAWREECHKAYVDNDRVLFLGCFLHCLLIRQ